MTNVWTIHDDDFGLTFIVGAFTKRGLAKQYVQQHPQYSMRKEDESVLTNPFTPKQLLDRMPKRITLYRRGTYVVQNHMGAITCMQSAIWSAPGSRVDTCEVDEFSMRYTDPPVLIVSVTPIRQNNNQEYYIYVDVLGTNQEEVKNAFKDNVQAAVRQLQEQTE